MLPMWGKLLILEAWSGLNRCLSRVEQDEITKRLMKNEDAEVTLEEMALVGQPVTPEKIDQKVKETIKTD